MQHEAACQQGSDAISGEAIFMVHGRQMWSMLRQIDYLRGLPVGRFKIMLTFKFFLRLRLKNHKITTKASPERGHARKPETFNAEAQRTQGCAEKIKTDFLLCSPPLFLRLWVE
ncbi:MAG: hypothetical protein H7228_14670 [Polaromonas sp.]|nr:hypothetical protein [Polaromonas sp.]